MLIIFGDRFHISRSVLSKILKFQSSNSNYMVEKNPSKDEKPKDISLATLTLIRKTGSSKLEDLCSIWSNQENWNHKNFQYHLLSLQA